MWLPKLSRVLVISQLKMPPPGRVGDGKENEKAPGEFPGGLVVVKGSRAAQL